jgi:hypothetical protein
MHPIEERRDSEIGRTDASRDPRYGSVTGRKRDWRKLVGALLVAGVVVAGAPPAVADGGSTSPLKTLTTQFPLGGQKLCCRSHSRARSLQRDSAGSATGQGGLAGSGTSVVFIGSVALLALLLFLLGRELSAAFRAPNIGRPSRASRILEAPRSPSWRRPARSARPSAATGCPCLASHTGRRVPDGLTRCTDGRYEAIRRSAAPSDRGASSPRGSHLRINPIENP